MITIITKRPHRTVDVEHFGITKYTDKVTGKDVYKLYAQMDYASEGITSTVATPTGNKLSTVYKEREITLGRYDSEDVAIKIKEEIDSAVEDGEKLFRMP